MTTILRPPLLRRLGKKGSCIQIQRGHSTLENGEKEEPISFIPSAFFIPPAVVSRYLNCHLLSEVEQVERVNTVIGK